MSENCVDGYQAACTQPKWPNQVGSLDFCWSVFSSSTSFFLEPNGSFSEFVLYFFLLLISVPSLTPSAFAGSPLFPGYMSNPSTGFSAPSPPGYTGNPLANNLSANLFNTQSMFK